MKKIIAVLLFIAFSTISTLSTNATKTANVSLTPHSGKVIISVLDKYENTPIENASICIIETYEYFFTLKLGSTTPIELPTPKPKTLTPPTKEWTEYTILVYKTGYLPHIYYGLKMYPNITKTGVVINLTPLSENVNFAYTTSFENPDCSWEENLIKIYKH